MPTILIGLKDISLDLDKQIDWNALSEEEAISLIKRTYQFLSSEIEVSIVNGIATITLPEEKAQRAEEALKWYSQGTRQAEQGDYKRAAHLFERVLERLPNHIEARRDLAMAHLEMGNIEQAKRRLIQVLNLAPKDAWSYVLLANLYAKHEKDLERAEKWYRKAYELNPQDAILLTNYGALMIEKGNREQAEEFFERAIAANPDLPNSYYSLALLNLQDSKPAQTLEILQDLFVKS